MKKLITFIALTPTTALAHGLHAPVPDAAHGAAHAGIAVGAIAVAAIACIWAIRRFRS